MPKPDVFNNSAPKREETISISLNLCFEGKKSVQYHINWVDENGHSHDISNMDENHPDNEEK